jgi:hypothetical protein
MAESAPVAVGDRPRVLGRLRDRAERLRGAEFRGRLSFQRHRIDGERFWCPLAQNAPAAAGDERGHDVVAGLQAAHSRPGLLDNAGALMPAAVGEMADHAVALGDVVVGVAQPGGCHPDQHLVVLGPVEVGLDDLPLAGLPHQHRCPGLQRALRPVTRVR